MNKNFDDFINALIEVERQLNILYAKAEDLTDELAAAMKDIDFAGKDALFARFENLLIGITHETESEMGFARNDIYALYKYIVFRSKYNHFSDEELEKIIDGVLTMEDKKQIKTKNNGGYINIVKEIRQDWNDMFKNASYKKLCSQIFT